MSETRTDTTQSHPQGAVATDRGDVDSHGKHRGGAAPTEDSASPVHGRHRRPGDRDNAA
ncbi:hypothetical protein [Streptomyces paludis]|uniref:hypothetical protein n=1 Tax=Streptomyces paludis TaxID=2282738 RepID=UPI0015F2D2B8|nr:hypothetical protein [Streptomyces paludis]